MDSCRILIPNGMTNNPFLFQLVRSLQRRPEVATVQYGTRWLDDRSWPFDVVLFQWPEAMLDWREPGPDDLERFRGAVEWWRASGSVLAATVHNTLPHFEYKVNRHTRRLYEAVYGSCHAIVHLGEASRAAMRGELDLDFGHAEEVVIPHGNYAFFGEPAGREESRAHLRRRGVTSVEDTGEAVDGGEGALFLSLGTIRSDGELDLLKQAAGMLRRRDSRLLVAGRLPHTARRDPRYWTTRLPLRLFHPGLEVEERFVPDEEVRRYLGAADALLVPRIHSLNSGNVMLGYTFGKVVLGPDTGVIGEELRARENPVFEPGSPESLERGIDRALELLESDLGERNRRFALEERDWDRIAERYLELFKNLNAGEA